MQIFANSDDDVVPFANRIEDRVNNARVNVYFKALHQIELGHRYGDFFATFGDAVFLTRKEVEAYVESQGRWQGVRVRKGEVRRRPWMALELEDIREYDMVKKPERFVPVGGRYLRE